MAALAAACSLMLGSVFKRPYGAVVVDVGVVVDLVVDGDGDGDGSATQLGQHRNDPGQEFDRLAMLAFLKARQGTDDVEHRSAFHGGSTSERVVPSGVGFGTSSSGLGDVQRNRQCSTSQLIMKFGVSCGDLRCHLNGDSDELDGTPIHIQLLKTEHACMSTDTTWSCPSPSPSPSTTRSTTTPTSTTTLRQRPRQRQRPRDPWRAFK